MSPQDSLSSMRELSQSIDRVADRLKAANPKIRHIGPTPEEAAESEDRMKRIMRTQAEISVAPIRILETLERIEVLLQRLVDSGNPDGGASSGP